MVTSRGQRHRIWYFLGICFLSADDFLKQYLPALPQFGILLITFTVIEVSWYLIYALSGHKLSRYLQQAHVLKNFNRVTGGVFVGFAALMAASR